MGDPFKSKALFGMNNVGVCKFWKCLSVHNKLDTVDLFFSPLSPHPCFCKLPAPFPPCFLCTYPDVSFPAFS